MTENNSIKLHESGENYLKTILILNRKNGSVRSSDVAEWLGVSRPSVSNAVRYLRDGGYLRLDKHKKIHLTASGREIAEKVYERHCFLKNILISVGVYPETAEKDACKIEHDLSDESFEKLKKFKEFHDQSGN